MSRIDKVRTKKGSNYPSCGREKCKKGNLSRKAGQFWCDSCENSVEYPVIRYRLEMMKKNTWVCLPPWQTLWEQATLWSSNPTHIMSMGTMRASPAGKVVTNEVVEGRS
ncbi:nucleic acid-binding, OB-fold protein [Tanacetum coccineum]